jgi:hypothetical protein
MRAARSSVSPVASGTNRQSQELFNREDEAACPPIMASAVAREIFGLGGHPGRWSAYVNAAAYGLVKVLAGGSPPAHHKSVYRQYEWGDMIFIEIRDGRVVIHAHKYIVGIEPGAVHRSATAWQSLAASAGP